MKQISMGRVERMDVRLMRSLPMTITISSDVPRPTNPIMNPPKTPIRRMIVYDFTVYPKSTLAPFYPTTLGLGTISIPGLAGTESGCS
jgi:hypothetical protein